MKKLIAVLAVLIGLLLVAGFVYVLVFMEEPPDSILVDSQKGQSQEGQPQLPSQGLDDGADQQRAEQPLSHCP